MGMLVELNQSGISKPHALVLSPGLLVRRSHARFFRRGHKGTSRLYSKNVAQCTRETLSPNYSLIPL